VSKSHRLNRHSSWFPRESSKKKIASAKFKVVIILLTNGPLWLEAHERRKTGRILTRRGQMSLKSLSENSESVRKTGVAACGAGDSIKPRSTLGFMLAPASQAATQFSRLRRRCRFSDIIQWGESTQEFSFRIARKLYLLVCSMPNSARISFPVGLTSAV
jgi:hypothetical protein